MTQLAPADLDLAPSLLRSLATLLRLRGRPVSPRFLLSQLAGGSTAAACLRAASRAGLSGRIMPRPELASISPLTLPCILLLKDDRACVLTALNGDEATVILPEHGENPQQTTRAALEQEYTGYALFGSVTPRSDPRSTGLTLGRGKRWFWDVIAYYAPLYRHMLFASVFINLIAVASPLFVMNVYDRVVPNKALETLWVLALGIGVAYLFDAVLRSLRSHFVDTAGRNADVVLSGMLMEKVLGMRLDAKPESTGALVNNVREFESLREFFSSSTLLACVDMPFVLLFLAVMAFIGGPLVLVPLLAIPLLLGSGIALQKLARREAEGLYRHSMHKNALLVEMVNGLETLKTCQAESRMQRLWETVCGITAHSAAENRRYASLAVVVSTCMTQFVTVGMTVWGVYLIADGSLTMGGLIGCNILVGRTMAPLLQMASLLTRWQHSRIALQALDMLMAMPSEEQKDDAGVAFSGAEFSALSPSFTLENVTFAYPQAGRNALENVSLHIHAGEKVGIVGGMGSGKSTLGKLLVGLYPPQEGAVRFGGVDLRQLSCADLRGRAGFLPQDVLLFYGTIRDNIALGDPVLNDALVLRAAELAGVSDFVRLFPAGFGTQVGEQGKFLSGGQRQAVALARALVRDPEVLILDEPSSNMDQAAEGRLQQRLAATLGEKTVLIISHRVSMLRLVDRIIALDNGKIILDAPRQEALVRLGLEKAEATAKPQAPSAPGQQRIEGSVAGLFNLAGRQESPQAAPRTTEGDA